MMPARPAKRRNRCWSICAVGGASSDSLAARHRAQPAPPGEYDAVVFEYSVDALGPVDKRNPVQQARVLGSWVLM